MLISIQIILLYLLLALTPMIKYIPHGMMILGIVVLGLGLITYQIHKSKSMIIIYHIIDYAIIYCVLLGLIIAWASPFLMLSLTGYLKYIFYLSLYFVLRHIALQAGGIRHIITGILLGSIWVYIESALQLMHGAEPLATWQDPTLSDSLKLTRIYSILLNPNLLGIFLLPLWLLYLYFGWNAWNRRQESQTKDKDLYIVLLWILLAGFSLYCMLETGSRAIWLGLIAQILIIGIGILPYIPRWLGIWSWILGSFGIIYYLLGHMSIISRLMTVFQSNSDSSNSFRINVWQACLNIFSNNGLWGTGWGEKCFYQTYAIYMLGEFSALGAYSIPLELAVEGGIGGLSMYFLLILSIIYTIYRMWYRERILALFALAIAIGYIIATLFDIVILRPQAMILFISLLAIWSSIYQEKILSKQDLKKS